MMISKDTKASSKFYPLNVLRNILNFIFLVRFGVCKIENLHHPINAFSQRYLQKVINIQRRKSLIRLWRSFGGLGVVEISMQVEVLAGEKRWRTILMAKKCGFTWWQYSRLATHNNNS